MRTLEQEESRELHLARDQSRFKLGSFLEQFLLAFQNADNSNFEILRPAMNQLIKKYDMECTCQPPVVFPMVELREAESKK